MIGSLALDEDGARTISYCRGLAVDLFLQSHNYTSTGFCLLFITPDGERTMRCYPGCASIINKPTTAVPYVKEFLIELYLFSRRANIRNVFDWIVQLKNKNQSVNISLCSGSMQLFNEHRHLIFQWGKRKIITRMFMNLDEARALVKLPHAEPKDLKHYFTDFEMVVITNGEHGSYVIYDNDIIYIAAVPGRFENTTCAGDIYAGEFILQLLRKQPLQVCGREAAFQVTNILSKS